MSKNRPSVLITGANRGLGLALTQHYAAHDWRVYATCRQTSSALELLVDNVCVSTHHLDVSDKQSILGLAAELDSCSIDVLLNNAGISGTTSAPLAEVTGEGFMQCMRTNALGPLLMARAFVPQVTRSQRRIIANISSRLGSIEKNDWGGWYVYGTSKAVLNRLTVQLAQSLEPNGITVTALHPGWVSTDMGGSEGPVTPSQSATGLAAVIDSLGPQTTGKFYDYTGAEWPW